MNNYDIIVLGETMKLNKRNESIQDYLETILTLSKNGRVRSIDIAQEMDYSKPSISIAMKKIKEKGYILIDDKGYITLTDEGYEIAKSVYEKHELLAEILISLGVEKEIAYQDACRLEHDLSETTFEAIKKYYQKIKKQ